jgi:hypothetical protein
MRKFLRSLGLTASISRSPFMFAQRPKIECVASGADYYRADGVRITHDPFAPGMAEKYGAPGETDAVGFDPYRDSVGPGIYGGIVKRDALGRVAVGKQYQNHNPRPGPVYAGGGYTPVSEALRDSGDRGKLVDMLEKYPDLVNDVSTGGATPLHMCGMGKENQKAVEVLVQYGADIEAVETYGMTPLHRMASNNLPIGAKALLAAGSDPKFEGRTGATPEQIARETGAKDVLKVLREFPATDGRLNMEALRIDGADVVAQAQPLSKTDLPRELLEVPQIVGTYKVQSPADIPKSFIEVCRQAGWNPGDMWQKLQGGPEKGNPWFKHTDNESYVYRNLSDGLWWIDGPSGMGVFTAEGPPNAVPAHGWRFLGQKPGAATVVLPPMVRTFRRAQREEGAVEKVILY